MQIGQNELEKLVMHGEKIWKRAENPKRKYIFFENNKEFWLSLMISKFVTAKSLEEKYGYGTIAIKSGFDKECNSIYKSFGMDTFFLTGKKHLGAYIIGCIKTWIYLLGGNSGERLLKLQYKGIHMGDLVYDQIIRSVKGKYTVDKVHGKAEFQILAKAFAVADICEKLYKKYPPAYFVAGDVICINGIYVRMAIKHGAKVVEVCTGYETRLYTKNYQNKAFEPNYHEVAGDEVEQTIRNGMPEGWLEEAEKRLENVFRGIGDWNTENAFGNKKVEEKNRVLSQIGICNDKKNIIIMAHCFSDAPHCGGEFIYKDYYEWLEETLKLTARIDCVNWILRAHPSRAQYGEQGVVEALYEKYNNENLHWLSDEYSAAMVPVLADALVTVNGTAGVEFSCKGIPCVNAGTAFYTRLGFTQQAKTKQEYEEILKNLYQIEPLSEEKKLMAKKAFYLNSHLRTLVDDSLQSMAFQCYKKNFNDRTETQKYNNEFVEQYVREFNGERIRSSYFYRSAQKM